MNQKERDNRSIVEFDFTSRRRWVPLRGMAGAPDLQARSTNPRGGDSKGGAAVEWLIVGGGIHGTYLSHFLAERLGVDSSGLRVLDPSGRPMATWLRNTENVGMEYLRSAAVHHLDLPSLSLKRFAARAGGKWGGRPPFIPPYGRPLLELFNEHAADVVARRGLEALRVAGRASALRAKAGGYEVDYLTSGGGGTIAARNVLLAIGMDDLTCWPQWALDLRRSGARVHHVLDPDFRRRELSPWRRAVVYGGGLSGAQVSASLAQLHPGSVTLISGHEMEVHLFDSEPSWQGGNFMSAFAAESDPRRRREIIAHERHRGSLTPEAQSELERLREGGAMHEVTAEPSRLNARSLGGPSFRITAGGEGIEADLLLLATGYDTRRPGGAWIDRAIEEMGLPCAPCGYPIVAPSLEWRRGLYVSGPLAELELGPVARNISGAHRSAARLEYFLAEELRRAS